MTETKNGRLAWAIPALLLLATAIVVWLSPEEQSLGRGIKIVYVHVALIWASMLGFAINGLLGLLMAAANQLRLEPWVRTISLVSLLLFVASVLVSLLAEQVSWGGILWAEPRNRAVFAVTAVAVIVYILYDWSPWLRLRGLLVAALAAYVVISLPGAPNVMHPDNPGRASSSLGIRGTFYILAIMAFLFGAWVVWYLRKSAEKPTLAAHAGQPAQ